ncbi:MAG: hypothetical protein AB7I37_12385, partial [Pirellulales bacterium]
MAVLADWFSCRGRRLPCWGLPAISRIIFGRRSSLEPGRFRIGLITVIGLVLLRLGCGWHFLQEGIWKRENPSFSAAGFLRQSRGPLRDRFLNLIPDIDGQERLSPETMSQR